MRRSFPMVNLSAVLILFNPLKERSAERDVTGNEHITNSSSLMLRN